MGLISLQLNLYSFQQLKKEKVPVVIVDNNSTDNSWKVFKNIKGTKRFDWLENDKNIGFADPL